MGFFISIAQPSSLIQNGRLKYRFVRNKIIASLSLTPCSIAFSVISPLRFMSRQQFIPRESRFWPWDYERWRTNRCARDSDNNWVKGWLSRKFEDCPSRIRKFIEHQHEHGLMIPFRRRNFEVQALKFWRRDEKKRDKREREREREKREKKKIDLYQFYSN